ncbi:MAG: hypothetical protein JRG82_19460, partial [Deltaproteobacteria bacterium]|nr:hypothetical protein [Deltaproteobacteria bacterium]
WLAPDAELSAPVRDLLGLAGSLHLPILQRMLELGGGPRQTYKGHYLLWLRRELADLPVDVRDRIEPLLRDAACWDALQLAPGDRDKVPPMLPV